MNNYYVMSFEECQRCKQFEPDHDHRNCGFDIERKGDIVIQTFECTRCYFKWTKEYNYESSSY